MEIYCCGCETDVTATGATGSEIYPHRKDLRKLLFWKCSACNNYVGTHRDSMRPLGCIPTPRIRTLRSRIHAMIDPLWQNKLIKRKELYRLLSKITGTEYHTANLRSEAECVKLIGIAELIVNEITQEHHNACKD